ncbi:MAG: dihydropteroate synthase [Candidatus Omnitrophota bacterium]
MGVLNITPDSFSDGGKFFDKKEAFRHAVRMASDGADIIDIGGESTRPGAEDLDVRSECERVIPVIESIAGKIDIPISIDTRKAVVAEEALKAGASIVNDVSGLTYDTGLAGVAAKYGAFTILMHMKGTPKDMQQAPSYDNLISEIIESLRSSIDIATSAGIPEENIIIDPGIGFGKTLEHNIEILRRLDEFKILNKPICIGTSRKSFIGKILNEPDPASRLAGSIAAGVVAVMKGANILRVHDCLEAREASRVVDAINKVRAD